MPTLGEFLGGNRVLMNQEIPVDQRILTAVTRLDRFRGTWSADPGIPADRLGRIAEAARIQSVASSMRLAGIRLSDAEVAGLLQEPVVPTAESGEVRGYAEALTCALPVSGQLLSAAHLRKLHAVIAGRGSVDVEPSPWRHKPLYREVFDAQGRATGQIFGTLPPHLIADAVEDQLTWLEFELRAGERHPVLVVGAFVLGLLATSPFENCNGRLARLLLPRLLERVGYTYIPYASVEREIEELREPYHEAYARAQMGFWKGQADLQPWLEVLLEALTRHRKRVEAKVELEKGALDYPPLQRQILDTVREHGSVDAGLLLRATGANRNTLKDNLRRLVDRGALEKTGQRRGTRYRLAVLEPIRSVSRIGLDGNAREG